MRCPDCSKFVPYDTEAEPEAEEPSFATNGISVSVRRVLPCGECGTELKEYTFELEADLEAPEKCTGAEDGEHEFEVDGDLNIEATTDVKRTYWDKRRQKEVPITKSRYMKTLYGVSVTGSVKCAHCDFQKDIELSDSVAASGMDECC